MPLRTTVFPPTIQLSLSLLVLFLAISPFAGAQSFSIKEYATGAGPAQVIRADFNHDGAPDLATANNLANSVSVLINNGDGTFRSPVSYATGNAPTDIVAADLNGDGNLDIVSSNDEADEAHTLSVLLGNSNGTFQAKRDFFGGSGPVGIVAGDFNGDGKADVATGWLVPATSSSYSSNQISVFLGDGAGGFSAEIRTSNVGEQEEPGESDRRMTGIARGDFNGDKKPDIAFIECCGGFDVDVGDVYVLMGTGDGHFQQKKVADVSVPLRVSTADVNQDGRSDILTSYQGCHTPCLGVWMFTSKGDGTFSSSGVGAFSDYDRYFGLGTPLALDANGDGLKDIAVGLRDIGELYNQPNRDVLAVMLRQPDGSYPTQKEFTLGDSRGLRTLAGGDYNRDGKPDIATGNLNASTSSVLLNTTTGIGCTPSSTNRSVKICRPASGATVTNPVHLLANTTDTSRVTGMKIYVNSSAVFSGDEDSISVLRTLPVGSNRITVRAWDAAGSFSNTITVKVNNGCTASTVDPSVTICTPADGATVASPVHVLAKSTDSHPVTLMQIYIDGVKKYQVAASSIDTNLPLPAGQHRFTVQAKDNIGQIFKKTIFITVR